MDSFTLAVASALAATIMAISMGLLYLASSRRVCLYNWAMAGLFFAASSVIGACAIKFRLDHVLVPAASNVLYVAGHYGILAGLRRHLKLRPRWNLLAALALLVFGVHLVPALQGALTVVLAPAVMAIDLAAAWLLWRQPDRGARLAYLPMIVLEAGFAAQQGARALYDALHMGAGHGIAHCQLLQACGALFVLVFLSVATMSCALIVTHDQTRALRRASLTDVLTGWLNRRALHDIALREFRRSERSGAAIHFITFDIDHFKSINDRYGHGVGDAAICHVTTVAARVLRGCDALFRIGGEEFAVLVADSRPADVCRIAERLREMVAALPLITEGQAVAMTVSVGVAGLDVDDMRWEDILRRADEALYHAKQNGRNRVSVHGVDQIIHLDDAARATSRDTVEQFNLERSTGRTVTR
jgi:diguanylate cyclase (GGDEF)-like protein